jgi:hypothetical protein
MIDVQRLRGDPAIARRLDSRARRDDLSARDAVKGLLPSPREPSSPRAWRSSSNSESSRCARGRALSLRAWENCGGFRPAEVVGVRRRGRRHRDDRDLDRRRARSPAQEHGSPLGERRTLVLPAPAAALRRSTTRRSGRGSLERPRDRLQELARRRGGTDPAPHRGSRLHGEPARSRAFARAAWSRRPAGRRRRQP